MPMPKKIELQIEHFLFTSRWLMVPIYLGLVGAMGILVFKFVKEIIAIMTTLTTASGNDVIVGVLTLVDVALIMNLLIIIIFSGYENFVSKMEDLHSHQDRPDWMGRIGFTDLKLKLIGSIVAISGVELLKNFMKVESVGDRELAWLVGIHLTFVVSGVLYALMDRIGASAPKK